jgi:hypothetical protein
MTTACAPAWWGLAVVGYPSRVAEHRHVHSPVYVVANVQERTLEHEKRNGYLFGK